MQYRQVSAQQQGRAVTCNRAAAGYAATHKSEACGDGTIDMCIPWYVCKYVHLHACIEGSHAMHVGERSTSSGLRSAVLSERRDEAANSDACSITSSQELLAAISGQDYAAVGGRSAGCAELLSAVIAMPMVRC